MPRDEPVDPGGQNVTPSTTDRVLRSQSQSSQKRGLEVVPNLNDQSLLPPRPKSPYRQQESAGGQTPSSSGGGGSILPRINITLCNQYDMLMNRRQDDEGELVDDVSDDEMPSLTPIPGTKRRSTVNKAKKVRVPPISVYKLTTRQLREFMAKSNIAQTDFNMKATKTGVQLLCTSDESFRNTVEAMKKGNIEFHTFTPASEQPVKIILSGLSVYDIAELEAELADKGVTPTEVKLFSRKVVGLEESALYLLHFVKGSVKLTELRKVKALFNVVVKWRYFERKPTDAVQCHRCQRYGHGMRNCNLTPFCVKCGEKHLSTECQLPKKAELQQGDTNPTREAIKCANCSGQHTANYRGCPSRKNYVEKLAKLRAERRQPTPPSIPLPPVQQPSSNPSTQTLTQSYAQVLNGHNSENSNLFTMSEFLILARDMFKRLANCKTKEDQIEALFELTIKYLYNV